MREGERGRPGRAEAEAAVRLLLRYLGEDPDRPELLATPGRVVAALDEYFAGYGRDPVAALGEPMPAGEMRGQLVEIRDIAFASHCEHHMAPFFGTVDVVLRVGARLPGIGHVASLVEVLARRLQIQERLTRQIADHLERALAPEGLVVAVRGFHTCMALRGPCRRRAWLRTVEGRGRFAVAPEALVARLGLGGGAPDGRGHDG